MSRTIRCKHYLEEHNSSWDRQYRRVIGDYVKYEYRVIRYSNIDEYGTPGFIYYHNCHVISAFRPATKLEIRKINRDRYGESSHKNQRSPGKEYRSFRHRENRQRDRRELQKFMVNPDYEPMPYEEPISCLWDWR